MQLDGENCTQDAKKIERLENMLDMSIQIEEQIFTDDSCMQEHNVSGYMLQDKNNQRPGQCITIMADSRRVVQVAQICHGLRDDHKMSSIRKMAK